MARTSTRPPRDRGPQRTSGGNSERLLLLAIVLLGVIGLAVSYGGRDGRADSPAASAGDTVSSDGQLRSDHMILNLNQRTVDREKPSRISRF